MLRAVEGTIGVLADHGTPSAEYLALKVEDARMGRSQQSL